LQTNAAEKVSPHVIAHDIEDIYSPYDAITSTVQEMIDGDTVETRLMGLESFVGVQLWQRCTRPSRGVSSPLTKVLTSMSFAK
jgi:hypothetical protein